MSDSQPQQAAQQQQQQLLRADDILRLQCLGDDEKQKHRVVMQSLWSMTQQHAQGSAEYVQARQKLTEYSTKLIARERQYRGRMRAQQQQTQASSSQGNQGAQQNTPQNATPQQEQAQPATNNAAAPQQPPAQQAQQAQNAGQARPPPPTANATAQIDPSIVKHVHDFPFALPPGGPVLGTAEGDAKLKELKNMYLNLLAKSANFTTQMGKINTQIQERQRTGQDVPQELFAAKVRVEREYTQAKNQVDKFRTMQKSWKEEREQKEAQQQGQGQQSQAQPQAQHQPTPQHIQTPQQPTHQQPQRHPNQPGMQPQPLVKEEPQIKIEGGQPPQPQPAAQYNMQGNAQQQAQQQQQQQQQQPQQQPQQNMHQQAPVHSLPQQPQQQQQQFPRQPPAPHPQQMPPNQGQQFASGQQQLPQQHARPQINPHQANAHQHQQTNSPHPQSATNAGPPVPLSHQAAVSAANRSYTDGGPRTNTPMGPGGQGNFHAPGSREREQLNNPKMPIPRHLNVAAPMPVNMGQARPTMSGPTNGAPGPMGQPVIPRPPPFQLEGEGERVLSKRKLDELVRQVTGGGEEALTPEVEEAVMQLADDFVDNVISSACKLSKLRESPQLDIRDMQLILERNYNIRIPGYASDEVRTVRKIVPATGWVEKMKAINAAKVMGGKSDF